MPVLKPFEQIDAGGVDSRSNPINMPRNRALRCLNWVPRQAGFWELRWGYSTVTMSVVLNAAISGMFPYRTWDGHKYVIFVQNFSLRILDTATGTVTTPTIGGAAQVSTAKGAGFFANNRFHYGNGGDQKWFDGNMWRDSGLPALTLAQIQGITVSEGVRELTSTQASAITLTAAAGGTFPADTLSGHLIYVAIFDTSNNEIGPATIFVSAARITVALNNKITVAVLPNLSSVNTNWVKLIAGTVDGGNIASFFTNTSTTITSSTRLGTTLTVISTSHGLSTNDVVGLSGTTNFDGVYIVTVVDANTFTVTLPANNVAASTTGGTCQRIVQAGNATTSVDVLGPAQYLPYQVNQNRGLAASTIGGPNAGYQFYACIYRPNGGGHAGNRIAIGPRALQTAYRSNWHIAGLPSFVGLFDNEAASLIGRTGDGAQVPYVCTDNAGNWLFTTPGIVPAQTSLIVSDPLTDGNHELPTRNGIIPSQCNMFAVAGDFVYAGDTGSPFVRRCGDLSQATENANVFTGRPEQSWAPDDVNTFPTAEALVGMFEIDQEVFCGTQHDSALLVNLAGVPQWIGPWNVGIAGRRAGTKCGAHGFYWISGDKQLCTLEQGVPVAVSEEYEAAELSQIGSSFLSQVELVYYRDATLQKDELRIEGQLQSGAPYTIIHDFKNREIFSAPGSLFGQGYSSQFSGPLGTVFTSAQVRDSSGALRVYCGASTGQIYNLYSAANDAGTEYNADLILLVNGGTNRPSVPFIDWYGDGEIDVSKGTTLSTSLAPGAEFAFQAVTPADNPAQSVPGAENDFLYRAWFDTPEVQHAYMRFQLTSHSVDGNLSLNSPPHIPLENYGRIYEIIPVIGDERER